MDAAGRSSLPRRSPTSSEFTSTAERQPLPTSTAGLPALDPAFGAVLDDGLQALDMELPGPARDALEAQARLLLAWNRHINLTALRTAELVARGHVLDSLLAVPALRRLVDDDSPSVLDLGSGGGYPGLPVALVLPARRVALVDSVAKKASFLRVVVDAARDTMSAGGASAPEITVLAERAEDLADDPEQREAWDLVIARAVGSVAELAEIGMPLVRVGGAVAIWKRDTGNRLLRDEVGAGAPACRAVGGGRPLVVPLDGASSVGLAGHCLVVVSKRRTTPDRFPRPAGERRRRPLT